jgi:hypothetical protein
MIASGRQRLRRIVEQAADIDLVSGHHDISTFSGEELFAFSLAAAPALSGQKAARRNFPKNTERESAVNRPCGHHSLSGGRPSCTGQVNP